MKSPKKIRKLTSVNRPANTDEQKPLMITYQGNSHMVKRLGREYYGYNYLENTLDIRVCAVGEESSKRGCTGFDF